MAAARRLLFVLAIALTALVAVHPVLGGIGASGGAPAVGRSGTGFSDSAGFAPGRAVTGSVIVSNTGTAPGTFVLASSTGGSRLLAKRLRISVSHRGRALYEGSLSRLSGVRLGRLAPGAFVRLKLRAELPVDAGNALRGLAGDAGLTVTAVGT